jgi:dolichyl-phosphate-mannose-protein mannosyltransferase
VTPHSKAHRRKSARHERPHASPQPIATSPSRPIWDRSLVALVLLGALARAYYLRQPMRYDESVTYLYFASQSWGDAVSSYIYPNNHVFHTLLVKACVAVLGDDPWVLRLPAFVAGVAMIPATYSVGRRLFGSPAAYIGAAFVTASGALTFYSANARGYTIVCLATLVLADVLLRLRERPSMALWSAVVVVTALGVWTVPVMLFPAGGLALWFVLSAMRGDTSEPRADLARFGVAATATALLTLLLYTPIIIDAGLSALIGNSFVRATSWRLFFLQTSSSLGTILASWTLGYPIAISTVLAACAIVGLVFERATSGIRVSMAGSVYVWCAFLLLVTHRVPFSRIWLFLVAPIALLAGHGMIRLASRLARHQQRIASWGGELSVGMATALVLVVLVTRGVETSRDTGTLNDAERIAKGFSSGLRPGDRVFAPVPSNGPLAYYFLRAGVDTSYLSSVPNDSSRVYLVVNTGEGFTLNTGLNEPLLQKYRRAQLMARFPSSEVYRLF